MPSLRRDAGCALVYTEVHPSPGTGFRGLSYRVYTAHACLLRELGNVDEQTAQAADFFPHPERHAGLPGLYPPHA